MSLTVPTNEGASFGRRIVSAAFAQTLGRQRRGGDRILLSADLDGTRFQAEADIRRRAAQALVRFGRDTGAAMIRDDLPADISKQVIPSADKNLFTVAFSAATLVETFERQATAQYDVWTEITQEQVEIDPERVRALGRSLKAMADALHVAVVDPANVRVFGAS